MATEPYLNSSTIPIIYGPNGSPISRVNESQLVESLVGSYDDYQAYSFILAPYNPDIWIASRGYQEIDKMMALTAVQSPLNTLRDALVYKGVTVEPCVNDEGASDYATAAMFADGFRWTLNNIVDEADHPQDIRQSIFETGYGIHTGFHVAEIDWRLCEDGPIKGKYGLATIAHKNCRQIGFDVDKRTMAVRNITSYTPLSGYRFGLPVEKCLRYTFAPRENLPYGNGIGRAAYKHSWSIDFLYKFWNIALEVFGTPFILGKAAPNAIVLARKVIQEIRQGAPAILPSGVEAQLIESAGNSVLGFKAAVEHHTQACAYAYLGNTLTTGEGQRSGSMALGQVHQDQQDYGMSGRRRDIEHVYTRQLARRWVRYNYGREFEYLTPRVSLGNWDADDSANMAKAVSTLTKAKVLHPAEPQIRQRLGFAPARLEDRERLENAWNASPGPIVINSDPADDGQQDDQQDPANEEVNDA